MRIIPLGHPLDRSPSLFQARHDLLPQLSRLRVPAEPGPAAVPRRQVDEVRVEAMYGCHVILTRRQLEYLCLGCRALQPRRMQELRWPLRVSLHTRDVRGLDHGGLHDRQLDVLYADGADAAGRVLVCVLVAFMSVCMTDVCCSSFRQVLMNGTGEPVRSPETCYRTVLT